VDTFKGDVDAS